MKPEMEYLIPVVTTSSPQVEPRSMAARIIKPPAIEMSRGLYDVDSYGMAIDGRDIFLLSSIVLWDSCLVYGLSDTDTSGFVLMGTVIPISFGFSLGF
jgi:hypothetical protein